MIQYFDSWTLTGGAAVITLRTMALQLHFGDFDIEKKAIAATAI